MRDPPIPVIVLTGFLGAGKTTLLNRLLKDPALADAAVVINEFGAVGIDHLLVEAIGDDVVLLASGCLCCTIRGELVDTLADLAARREAGTVPAFRRLVIETTGLADPAPILQTLIAHPRLSPSYRLDGIVTVVDAVHGDATLDEQAESLRQIAVADHILLAKTELADPAALERLAHRLRALNPGAAIDDARTASAASILDAAPFDATAKPEDVRAWLAAEAHLAAHGHGHAHAHDVDRHDASIRAFSLTTNQPIPTVRLEGFLDLLRSRHGEGLLRFKAIVAIAEDPSRPVVLHGVRHVLHEPIRLAAWPDEDRASRLVFIVRDVDPAAVETLFATFLGTPRIDQPDAAALLDNPLALI